MGLKYNSIRADVVFHLKIKFNFTDSLSLSEMAEDNITTKLIATYTSLKITNLFSDFYLCVSHFKTYCNGQQSVAVHM